MALKDWKKTGEYLYSLGWVNKYKDKIIIWFMDKPIKVGIYSDTVLLKINSFKSKSQALKFAKSYMRTH